MSERVVKANIKQVMGQEIDQPMDQPQQLDAIKKKREEQQKKQLKWQIDFFVKKATFIISQLSCPSYQGVVTSPLVLLKLRQLHILMSKDYKINEILQETKIIEQVKKQNIKQFISKTVINIKQFGKPQKLLDTLHTKDQIDIFILNIWWVICILLNPCCQCFYTQSIVMIRLRELNHLISIIFKIYEDENKEKKNIIHQVKGNIKEIINISQAMNKQQQLAKRQKCKKSEQKMLTAFRYDRLKEIFQRKTIKNYFVDRPQQKLKFIQDQQQRCRRLEETDSD